MKIYVRIDTREELDSFSEFLLENHLHVAEYFGPETYYCLDNVTKDVNDIPGDQIPKGCVMLWDKDLIQKTYNNEIIGRFNQGKPQWTLMNSKAIEPMIQVLMYGAQKYERNNWMKACPKRLDLMDSLERHSLKIIAGESIDPESGLPHIGHLMCNAMFYSYWEQKTNGQFENFEASK
jgi:hypothetical protein